MFKLIIIWCITLYIGESIIYIDRHTLDFDEKLANWTISYFHDQKRNSVSNVTMQTFKTFTKMLVYFNVKVSENPDDREYHREVVRTVIDYCKFMQNTQNNPILRAFLGSLKNSFPFNTSYPMKPVSFDSEFDFFELLTVFQGTYKVINASFDALFLPINVKGSIEFRVLGRIQGQSKMLYMTQFT